MENIQIQDESNDRKYFTIIPNYILNHSTAKAQALYMQLKRLAGERGIAYPSRKWLMKQLNITKPTLIKELKYLIEKGWIKESGTCGVETKGGNQQTKAYQIIDLWNLNTNYYNTSKGVKNSTPKKNHIKKRERTLTQNNKISFFENPEEQEKIISFLKEKGVNQQVATNEIKKFVSYWTESNEVGKMRFQGEKYFDIKRRLVTWFSRIRNMNIRQHKHISI